MGTRRERVCWLSGEKRFGVVVIPKFSRLWVAVIWVTLEKVDRTLLANDGGGFTADEVKARQRKNGDRNKAANDTSYNV